MKAEAMETDGAFAAPWEAQVFALVLTLQRRGLFTWAEWSEVLAGVVSPTGAPTGNLADSPADSPAGGPASKRARQTELTDKMDSHYGHWLAALEKMVVSKGVGDAKELSTLYQSWDEAARATPHGQAIELKSRELKS